MWCEEFMSRLSFPDDAAEYIKNEDFQNTAIKAAAKRFYYEGAPMNDTLFLLRRVKNENTHIYTAQLLFVIACAEFLKKSYEELKLPEDIYWDTMNDVKCKLIECKAVHNIWGTFEPEWYNGFFRLKRFALGRLQFEKALFEWDDYTKHGYTVHKGDWVYNFHIPSNGQPLTQNAVLNSFRRAYDFFAADRNSDIMPIICKSWLLFPGHREYLPENSNIVKFGSMFDIFKAMYPAGFPDAWRVFGKDYNGDASQMPAETTLQRAILSWLQQGNGIGSGYGILLFDGENIL